MPRCAASIAFCALAAAGCVAVPPVAARDRPPLVIGEIVPTAAAVAQDDLVRPAGSVARYLVLRGKREGATLVQRVRWDGNQGRIEETLLGRGESREVPAENMLLSRAADGTLVLREVETFSEDSRSIFTDGLAFAAPSIAPGTALAAESPMKVVALSGSGKRPPKSRGSGSSRRSLRILGEAPIETWGTPERATVLELVFDVELDVARAHVESRLFVVRGRGVVAEERRERLVVLGLFPSNSEESVVLKSPEVPPPPTAGEHR